MPRIPILIERELDELLYTYILRLSDANGFKAVNEFAAVYIWPNADVEDVKAKVLRKDGFFNWDMLLKTINLELDIPHFFKESTLYSGIAPFMSKEQQNYLVNLAFREDTSFFTNASVSVIQELKSCPLCREQEIESKGYFWFHRSHQMPGVMKCNIHGCNLQVYHSRELGDNLKAPIFKEISQINELVNEVEYSNFTSRLLAIDLDVSLNQIIAAIYKKLSSLGFAPNKKGISSFIDSIQYSSDRGSILNDQVWDTLKLGSYVASKGKLLYWMILTYLLFNTVDELICYLPDCTDLDLEFFDKVKGYNVLNPYHRNLVLMQHKDCGSYFLTTAHGFVSGFDCPQCNIKRSETKRIKRLMMKTMGSSYQLEGLEWSSSHKVNIIRYMHSPCGKENSVKPSDIFYNGSRCECERRVPLEDIQKKIRECGDYELVSFRSVNEEITIKHSECGKTFGIDYYNFLKNPYCRACLKQGNILNWKNNHSRGVLTEELFRSTLKNMVGSEYILDGNFINGSTYVSIRHSICGQSRMYKPNIFLQGVRCNCNIPKLFYNMLVKLVSELSSGKYIIVGRKSEVCFTVLNTENGDTFTMHKRIILQELRRLDGSLILPLGSRNEVDMSSIVEYTKTEPLLLYIQEQFGKGRTFSTSEIDLFIPHVKKRTRLLNMLVNQKLLIRMSKGLYKLPNDGNLSQDLLPDTFIKKKFEESDVIVEKFLYKNGCHIGYLYGKSLAYELGIIKNEPGKIYIVTNERAIKKIDRTASKYGKAQIVFRKPFEKINNDNYVILSIIDYLYSYPHFRRKYHGENTPGEYSLLKDYLINCNIAINDFDIYLEGFDDEELIKKEILRVYAAGPYPRAVFDIKTDDELFAYLKEHYHENDIIFSKDIQLYGFKKDYSEMFRMLIKKGLLRRVAKRGSYVFASYYKTDEAVAKAMYKEHMDKYIGYSYGRSFMYEIGLIKEKPERLYYCTNFFPKIVQLRANRIVGEITVVIRKPITVVTMQNRLILPLLDFLASFSDSRCRHKKMFEQECFCLREYIKKCGLLKDDCIECIKNIENNEFLLREIETLYEVLT